MAEKQTGKPAAKATGKPSFASRIKKYFRDVASEYKKIVWPSKKTVINNTIVVLTTVAIFAVVVWLLDLGFNQGRNALIDLLVNMAGGGGGA